MVVSEMSVAVAVTDIQMVALQFAIDSPSHILPAIVIRCRSGWTEIQEIS